MVTHVASWGILSLFAALSNVSTLKESCIYIRKHEIKHDSSYIFEFERPQKDLMRQTDRFFFFFLNSAKHDRCVCQ